jgi:hypothetical protein
MDRSGLAPRWLTLSGRMTAPPLAHLNRGRSSQTKDGSGVLCTAGCEVSGWGRSCPRAPDPSQVSVREVVGLSVLSFRWKLGGFKA